MIDKRIIKWYLDKGYDKSSIAVFLMHQGYGSKEINAAMNALPPQKQLIYTKTTRLSWIGRHPKLMVIFPLISILLIAIGFFIFINQEDTVVDYSEPLINPDESDKPFMINCGACQYIENNQCIDYACCENIHCNDLDGLTEDICENPGTKEAKCTYRAVKIIRPFTCGNDICELDRNESSENCCLDCGCGVNFECINSECRYRKSCKFDSDCNDKYNCTLDSCDGVTLECFYVEITGCNDNDDCCPVDCDEETDNDCGLCRSADECDDDDDCTFDECLDDGCENTIIDYCLDGDGCCPVDCIAVEDDDCLCYDDSDCDDDDDCTIDVCNNDDVCAYTEITDC